MSNHRLAVHAAFAVIYLVWGSTYLAVSLALTSIAPFMLMGSRSLAGGGLLFAAAWFGRHHIDQRGWARAGLCGVLLFVGCHGTLAYAQQRVSSGMAAVLLATIPFWIALIGALLPGGKRLRLTQLGLLGVGLVGVVFIVMGHDNGAGGTPHYMEIGMLLGSALSWAVGTILSERWSPPGQQVAFAGMALLAGGTVLMIMSGLRGEIQSFDVGALSGQALAAWLYLTLAGTVLAFAAYSWLLKQVPAALVATYTFVNPLIALVLGWAVLGEQLGMTMALGAGLVAASVVGLLIGREKTESHEELSTTVAAARLRI